MNRMEALIWILLPGFTAVASGLLAWFIMQSRLEVALALQRERLAETKGALDAEKSALGASLDTALRAAEAVVEHEVTVDEGADVGRLVQDMTIFDKGVVSIADAAPTKQLA